MKLWKKLSILTGVTLFLATGIFGGVVVYQAANYNLTQTINSSSKQVDTNANALTREIVNSNLEKFTDLGRSSYLQYLGRRYGGREYLLISLGETVYNDTPYELADTAGDRWESEEVEYAIQKQEDKYLLILGRGLKIRGSISHKLVLIKDITNLYDETKRQIAAFAGLYLVVALLSGNVIFWVTRRLLRPLNELQWTAAAIRQGDLSRRVRIRGKDEVGTVGLAFNQMADQIERQVEELEEVSAQRKQLLGSLTHELKTPMTSIIGYSDTLLHVKIGPEQQKRALEHINAECKRLERLSGKMMNLIGLYDNDSIVRKPYPVGKLLDQVAELESYHLKEKGMELSIFCSMDKLPMDVDLMESLFVNLIDNAIKASKEGDTIEVRAEENCISVKDHGKGIPKEEIPKITEAFYMVDKSRSKKAGGIGLGLALCTQIAAIHGAVMEIESEEGKGTTIRVKFLDMEEKKEQT